MKSRTTLTSLAFGSTVCRYLPLILLTVCTAHANTVVYDAATNFNVSNNPSASNVFSYGQGATLAAFSAVSNVTLNPIGTPSATIDGNTAPDAIFSWNGTGSTQNWSGTGIDQPTDFVRMDPQSTAGDILRFTAPVTGAYSVTGLFRGLDGNRGRFGGQVDVSVYVNATRVLGPTTISDSTTPVNINLSSLALTVGDKIDFIVLDSGASFLGPGTLDSTGLKVAISSVQPMTITLSATGPASPGAPIQFDVTTEPGWTVLMQAATTASPVDSDWTGLNDGNLGSMTEISSGNYRLTTTAYPAGPTVRFRALAVKTGQTTLISAPLSPMNLHQAVLSIGSSLISTSDFTRGATAYIDDYLIYKLTFKNSGDAPAKSLRITATVPDFLHGDIPLLVKTTLGSNTVTLVSGDTSQLSVGGLLTNGPIVTGTASANGYISGAALITAIIDATHFTISQPATKSAGTSTVSLLVQYPNQREQFKQSDISLSPYSHFDSSGGVLKMVWDVGDLQGKVPVIAPYGYSQYVTFAVHLTSKVRTGQSIRIGNDYKVESTSAPKQPVTDSTGYLSGSVSPVCQINGNISFLLNPLATTVAPGGLMTYVFSLTNRGSTAATNPVAVVDVPNNLRFGDTYANGAKGVVFIGTGTLNYKQVYRSGSPLPQLVLKFPSLAAKTTVQVKVTFQARWVTPPPGSNEVNTSINNINYGAAFLDPTAPSTAVAQFTSLFNAANTMSSISGSSSTYTVDSVKSSVALPGTGFTIANSTGAAPLAVSFTNTTTGTVTSWKWDFGDGTTSTVKSPPAHTYAQSGAYTVSLTATNTGGSRTVTTINAVVADAQDFFAFISSSTNTIASSLNQSGGINVALRGSLDGAPDLHLYKMLSNTVAKTENVGSGNPLDLVKPGDKLTFMLVIVNKGAAPADDVYVTERMPDYCTYDATTPASIPTGDASTKKPRALTASEKLCKLVTTQDPDGHHLRFTGLHLEPYDSVTFTCTVQLDNALSKRPFTLPMMLDVGPLSVGSGSTSSTPVGYVLAKQIKVTGTVMYAQPSLDKLISLPLASADINATKTALDTLYAKTPSAVPLTDSKNLLSYIPGVQRLYVHYENISSTSATGFKLTVPVPSNSVFYRASWVTLAANTNPGGLSGMPGAIAPAPAGGAIDKPAVLGASGDVVFHLPTLSGTGDVMVEVIISPSAIMQTGSHYGETSQMIAISDNGGNSAVLSLDQVPVADGAPTSLVSAASLAAAPRVAATATPLVPYVGLMRYISKSHVAPGEQFTITLVGFNFGDIPSAPQSSFTIPANCSLVSYSAGNSDAFLQNGTVIYATISSDNGATNGAANPLQPHSAGAVTITLQATGSAGSDIIDSTSRIDAPYLKPITAETARIHIVAADNPLLQQRTSNVQVFGHSFSQLNNGTVMIDLNKGSTLTQGDASQVDQGTGSVISQNDTNIIVAVDQARIVLVRTPDSNGSLTSPTSLLAGNSYAVTNGKIGSHVVIGENVVISPTAGRIVAQGGGNLVNTNGGNIVAQGGGNLITSDGGGIVAQGGGNIVAQGGGNIVAAGAGNIVAAGAGNIVAAGAWNIVAQGGGNAIGQHGASIVAQGGGN